MKVGILGGAFDPIHKDHINTAKAVLDAGLVDRILIMPCYKHKFGKRMASFEERWDMVALEAHAARKEGYKILASDAEYTLMHTGSTYDLVKDFLLDIFEKNGRQLYWIIGGDNARAIDKWANWQELIKLIPFIVVERDFDGQAVMNEWYKQAPHHYLDTMVGSSSSTEVRKAIEAGQPFEHLINPSTANYIKEHGLYR